MPDVDSDYVPFVEMVSTPNQIFEIKFTDRSGTTGTTQDANMGVWVVDHGRTKLLDPTSDIPDEFGNIWAGGMWSVGNA